MTNACPRRASYRYCMIMTEAFPEARENLFAVVLAAGSSRRFGSSKQLALYGGEPLVHRAVRVAEAACRQRSILVVGSDWRRVQSACAPLAGFLVRNDRYEDGMAGSIVSAVGALPPAASGVLLMLADQPLVTAADIQRLIDRWVETSGGIACSRHGTYEGPPAIFSRAFFSELSSLEGDRGARSVIRAHSERVVFVECRHVTSDVDTPDDLARLSGVR